MMQLRLKAIFIGTSKSNSKLLVKSSSLIQIHMISNLFHKMMLEPNLCLLCLNQAFPIKILFSAIQPKTTNCQAMSLEEQMRALLLCFHLFLNSVRLISMMLIRLLYLVKDTKPISKMPKESTSSYWIAVVRWVVLECRKLNRL